MVAGRSENRIEGNQHPMDARGDHHILGSGRDDVNPEILSIPSHDAIQRAARAKE